ncbi:MAG: TonB-dependent receptor plug domain-containing protein [Bacteroidales bacterium]|jgi:hypothetical protein|nr:TonB-dependent receptor plug domain-containing protein [Bacteroidales bacterium]
MYVHLLLFVLSLTLSVDAIALNLNTVNDTIKKVKDNTLREITIIGEKNILNAKNTTMSALEIPVIQVKKAPALFGESDLVKILQLLPGIQSLGDSGVGLQIRGGGIDQNSIYIDGATLFNLEHLKGLISAFNVDVLDKIIVYKGGFPAQYGGRLSGVIDVHTRDGDNTSFHGGVTIGILSAKAYFEGPVIKDKTAFIVSGRYSYYDLYAKPLLEKIYDNKKALSQFTKMRFNDLTAKLTHRFSNNNDYLSLLYYMGNDQFSIDSNNSESVSTDSQESGNVQSTINSSQYDTKNNWGNKVLNVRWKHSFSPQINLGMTLNFSDYQYIRSYKAEEKVEITNTIDKGSDFYHNVLSFADYNSNIREYAFASHLNYYISNKHFINFGIKISFQDFSPVVHSEKHTTTIIPGNNENIEKYDLLEMTHKDYSLLKKFSLYAEDDWQLSKYVKMILGARISGYAVKDALYPFFEPRLGIRFLLSDPFSVKISYTFMSQGMHLLSSNNLIMPSDLWVPISTNIKPMKAQQYALGLFYDLNENTHFSFEVYNKLMNNILEYKDGVSYINDSQKWESMVAVGKGSSYGAEFFAQTSYGKTTGWISYTWSKSIRSFNKEGNILNNGKWFYASNDCRNNLSINISYKINFNWEIAGTFVYQTGRRATLSDELIIGRLIIEADATIGSDKVYADGHHYNTEMEYDANSPVLLKTYKFYSQYSERNGFKLPDYHRLDLGINYYIRHKKGQSTLNFGIYNIYNHFNTYTLYMGYEDSKIVLKEICLFPFMPSFSYSYQF